MKIKRKWSLICMVLCGANLCIAQPSAVPASTNWGKSVQGVQLLITLTNNVVETGASITARIVMWNASTNIITVGITGTALDFGLVLRNGSGKPYDDLRPFPLSGSATSEMVTSGGIRERNVPVVFPSNIEPGEYTLVATRAFSSRAGSFMVESKPVRIQIKAKAGESVPAR